MGRMPIVGWFMLSFLSSVALGFTFFIGAFVASGKDIDETCAKAGQQLDRNYRAQNWQEPSQLFPLHDKCNAGYDMVPAWINPALVLFASLAAVFLCIFVVLALRVWKADRQRGHTQASP